MLGTNSFGGTDGDGKSRRPRSTKKKYAAFLTPIHTAVPEKPILCVTTILNRADLQTGGNPNGERPELYRKGIVRVVRRRMNGDRNLHLAVDRAMVNDPLFLLVTDRVHPNDAG